MVHVSPSMSLLDYCSIMGYLGAWLVFTAQPSWPTAGGQNLEGQPYDWCLPILVSCQQGRVPVASRWQFLQWRRWFALSWRRSCQKKGCWHDRLSFGKIKKSFFLLVSDQVCASFINNLDYCGWSLKILSNTIYFSLLFLFFSYLMNYKEQTSGKERKITLYEERILGLWIVVRPSFKITFIVLMQCGFYMIL